MGLNCPFPGVEYIEANSSLCRSNDSLQMSFHFITETWSDTGMYLPLTLI